MAPEGTQGLSSLEAGHQAALEAIKDLPPVTVESGQVVEQPGTTPDATPAGTEPAAATPEDGDSFTKLDPNSLPPELRPYYTSMQGDYTRKMQEAAPFRQLGDELGLDADGLRQAAELYAALHDPNQLVQFHNELTQALQQAGLSPADAQAAATAHVQETLNGPGADEFADPEDQRLQALEQRLAQYESAQQAQAEQFQREQLQMALVSEMNRQESIIREAHPDWSQGDIDVVYELSAFYGGSLLDAANRFDASVSDRVTRILNGKGAVSTDPAHAPLPPSIPGVSQPQSFGDDLDAAHAAAMEIVRRMPQ